MTAAQPLPQSSINLWAGLLMYTGRLFDTQIHRHHAVQMVVSLGKAFEYEDEEGVRTCDIVVVGANVPHRIKSPDGSVFLVLADPHSVLAVALERSTDTLLPQLRAVAGTHVDQQKDSLLRALGLGHDSELALLMDQRIARVLDHVEKKGAKRVSLAELAAVACLSPSRFAYLFKRHVGLPVRRYVLWQRLMHAVQCFAHGASLTEAAHEAEFSDQAHLARTVKAHFGLSVRDLKNSQFVQVRCHKGC